MRPDLILRQLVQDKSPKTRHNGRVKTKIQHREALYSTKSCFPNAEMGGRCDLPDRTLPQLHDPDIITGIGRRLGNHNRRGTGRSNVEVVADIHINEVLQHTPGPPGALQSIIADEGDSVRAACRIAGAVKIEHRDACNTTSTICR